MKPTQDSLFSWEDVDARPDLQRLKLVLDSLPDEKLIAALKAHRGRGRNDYPVEPMWRAFLAGIIFQHPSIESLIRELNRNPALLDLCGFNPLPRQGRGTVELVHNDDGTVRPVHRAGPTRDTVPNHWNFSRFQSVVAELDEQHGLVSDMIQHLLEALMEELPDFGKHLGFDGKALPSHSTGHNTPKTGKPSDTDADWGKHKTQSVAKDGKITTTTKKWFGYRVHVIADTNYEIPVSFNLTVASANENPICQQMVDELMERTPELAKRGEYFSADRGLDSGDLKAKLWDEWRIRPLVDTRLMWRDEKKEPGYDPTKPITRALNPDRVDTIVHTERGEVRCRCPETEEERDMAFAGFEADRGTLKYRCPAMAFGFTCEGQTECYEQAGCKAGDYGRVVRIKLEDRDRRIFTPTPWGSPKWRLGYKRRSALERIYSRFDQSFCFENHYIRGLAKMKFRSGLAITVMMALALGHVRAGRPEMMRSLVRTPYRDTG